MISASSSLESWRLKLLVSGFVFRAFIRLKLPGIVATEANDSPSSFTVHLPASSSLESWRLKRADELLWDGVQFPPQAPWNRGD